MTICNPGGVFSPIEQHKNSIVHPVDRATRKDLWRNTRRHTVKSLAVIYALNIS